MFIDVDSAVREVHGDGKPARPTATPELATRTDTGEILVARMRKGSAGSGRGSQPLRLPAFGRLTGLSRTLRSERPNGDDNA